MPNRIIKESICTSDSVDNLTWEEEVFFYRLIVNCDDYGRMDGRPAILRAKLYPLKLDKVKEKDIERYLSAAVKNQLVKLYTYEDRPYIQLATWDKHQQVRAKRSKYPAIDDDGVQLIEDDNNCNQMISDDNICPRNPIQSESNPNKNTSTHTRKKKVEKTEQKTQYSEFVYMTEEQYLKLEKELGKDLLAKCIEKLDNHKGATGQTYKSDYHAIKKWVIDAVKKEMPTLSNKTSLLSESTWQSYKPQPDPLCPKCNGTGKITYQTDDGSGDSIPITVTCECVKKKGA